MGNCGGSDKKHISGGKATGAESTFAVDKKLENRRVCVIIGGGFAGVTLAKTLDSSLNVVLIDRKDYFLMTPATPRAMVDASFAERIAIPYSNVLKNGHVVQGEVKRITNKSVELHGAEPVTGFDFLVIATGMSYAFPYKVPEPTFSNFQPQYDRVADKIKNSKNIVVVGGGSTGMESAAEIAETYPEVQVTLVHSKDTLMSGGTWGEYAPKFVKHINEQIERYPNIRVVLNDRLLPVEALGGEDSQYQMYVEPEGGHVSTQKGETIPCDLLFWCVGGKMNSASYEDHFKAALTKDKGLDVNDYLQVKGHANVFAIGDTIAASKGPQATVNYAGQHAKVVAKNILQIDKQWTQKGRDETPGIDEVENNKKHPLTAYKPGGVLCAQNLGKKYGTTQIPGPMGPVVMGTTTTQTIKKDMFTSKYWHEMGFNGVGREAIRKDHSSEAEADHLQDILGLDEDEVQKYQAGLGVEDTVKDHT